MIFSKYIQAIGSTFRSWFRGFTFFSWNNY